MIVEELIKLKNYKHIDFLFKLIPNIPKENILGIKSMEISNIAKKYKNNKEEVNNFLNDLPHKYLEENLLHLKFLEFEKDFKNLIDELEKILPYMDNWAFTDSFKPKLLLKYSEETYKYILKWLEDERVYIKRFAVVLLLKNYLNENFKKEHLDRVSKINSEDYYLSMAIAWYFSMALVKQYEIAIKFIEEYKLEKWIHNKTIQKAIESRNISEDKKKILKSLKK